MNDDVFARMVGQFTGDVTPPAHVLEPGDGIRHYCLEDDPESEE